MTVKSGDRLPIEALAKLTAQRMTEKAWRQKIVELAEQRLWYVYWTWISIHSPSGFPDLVLARNGRLIFAELKKEGGTVTRKQRDWLVMLGLVDGVSIYVWRPSDWDAICEVLR